MPKLIDLSGQRFGRLTVIRRAGSSHGHATWLCKCDCGNEHITSANYLKQGHTTSCGCRNQEVRRKRYLVHGESKGNRLYRIWQAMKRRCYNPKAAFYKDYGGRGIKVCDQWMHDFPAFRDWALANGYADNLTIDRIDEEGSYCPENCRWATAKQQVNNRRITKRLTYNGKTQSLSEWADATGIAHATIEGRLKRGWSIERALTEPVKKES